MIFKDQYLQRINATRDLASETALPDIPLPSGMTLDRPERTPVETWDSLSAPQRFRRSVQRLAGAVKNDELGLSEVDYMRLANDDVRISDRAAQVVMSLLDVSVYPQRNGTVPGLVRLVAEAERTNAPIQIVISQCLAKGDEIRPGKVAYFLQGDETPREVRQFAKDVERKGWDRIRRVLTEVNYPVEIKLLIGDMDFLTIDGCRGWCTPESLERLPLEMAELRNALTHQVQAQFGEDAPITVGQWSDYYDASAFDAAADRAADRTIWVEGDNLLQEAREMYRNQWRYGALERQLGLERGALDRFIQGDVCRTAAQYRLETDVARQRNAIQGWAESVPKPTWPIRISGYDGNPTAPSLLLI